MRMWFLCMVLEEAWCLCIPLTGSNIFVHLVKAALPSSSAGNFLCFLIHINFSWRIIWMFDYLIMCYSIIDHIQGWLCLKQLLLQCLTIVIFFICFLYVCCVYACMCMGGVDTHACAFKGQRRTPCVLYYCLPYPHQTNSGTEHEDRCAMLVSSISQPSSCLCTISTITTQWEGYPCAQPHSAFHTVVWKSKSPCSWSTLIYQAVSPSPTLFFSHCTLVYGQVDIFN